METANLNAVKRNVLISLCAAIFVMVLGVSINANAKAPSNVSQQAFTHAGRNFPAQDRSVVQGHATAKTHYDANPGFGQAQRVNCGLRCTAKYPLSYTYLKTTESGRLILSVYPRLLSPPLPLLMQITIASPMPRPYLKGLRRPMFRLPITGLHNCLPSCFMTFL